jgi:predicted dehydrogenase
LIGSALRAQPSALSNDAVDVVAVTVKVPDHLELATAALDPGKAVYCEWPLGNGLTEAETLAALAKRKGRDRDACGKRSMSNAPLIR